MCKFHDFLEFCEESSQDNVNSESESADEVGSMSNSPPHSENSNSATFDTWTRDEDKIILESFQKEDSKEKALKRITEQLANRTLPQIKARFVTLMNLLQAMAAKNQKT